MNRWWANIIHGVAIATTGYAAASPFIPIKYRILIGGGISVAQAVVGNIQQSYNPDGTPADKPYRSVKP